MQLITNGNIVLGDKIVKGEIKIVGNKIVEIGKRFRKNGKYIITDAENRYVLPGFVDVHTNGSAGFDLSSGTYNAGEKNFIHNKNEFRKGFENALRFYLKTGTTKVLLSSIAAPLSQLHDNFSKVAEYKNLNSVLSKVLFGIYIEGSFIKDSNSRGAQNPKYFLKPSRKVINQMIKSAGDLVRIINLPPEWGTDIIKIINELNRNGIICCVGHSAATAEQIYSAAASGTILATHFLNGPSSASFKPFSGGGVIEAVLKLSEMYAEIIPDGYHVDKAYVLDVVKKKGFDKVIAVTDNMFVTGIKGVDEFNYMGIQGKFSTNKEYIYVKERPSALFGSVLTMDKAFSNLLNWFTKNESGVWNENHPAMDFEEAVIAAVKMCSTNPSNLLGKYSPQNKFGRIEEGYNADLIIVDIVEKSNHYITKIKDIFLGGNRI